MQNKVVRESIWADGCPENIKDEFVIKVPELLIMAVDYFVKNYAIKNGFKVESVNANPNYFPHVILKKNDKLYAIAIAPFIYPNYACLNDQIRIDMVKNVREFNAEAYLAPVGFKSKDKARAEASLALRGDLFDVNFRGFIKLTDAEYQEMIIPNEDFVLLD